MQPNSTPPPLFPVANRQVLSGHRQQARTTYSNPEERVHEVGHAVIGRQVHEVGKPSIVPISPHFPPPAPRNVIPGAVAKPGPIPVKEKKQDQPLLFPVDKRR
jgi:hypothetical protein